MNGKICSLDDMLGAIEEYGLLPFWTEDGSVSAWSLSGVNFNALWEIREQAVNSHKIAYGKFIKKKSTFVSLKVFPHLCALRRDGYDFDSLCDEGLVPNREALIMSAVNSSAEPTPSYALGKRLNIKGYDAAITSLENKTYLCVTFKKSAMGTALLAPPENIFGAELVRSAYSLSAEDNVSILANTEYMKFLEATDKKEYLKALQKAV